MIYFSDLVGLPIELTGSNHAPVFATGDAQVLTVSAVDAEQSCAPFCAYTSRQTSRNTQVRTKGYSLPTDAR